MSINWKRIVEVQPRVETPLPPDPPIIHHKVVMYALVENEKEQYRYDGADVKWCVLYKNYRRR